MALLDNIKNGVKKMFNNTTNTNDDSLNEFPGTDDNLDTVLIRGITTITADMDTKTKLMYFQQRFWLSRSQWDWEIFDKRELEFYGDPTVDKNINDTNAEGFEKLSDCVYNIAVEFIESQIDNTVPQPTVTSKRPGFEDQAKMIEDAIKNDLLDTRINKWNDRNERTTYKHGFSALEVSWNPDYDKHCYNGDIEIIMRHPKQIIPQVGVWDIEKMDYIFVVNSATKEYIFERYGIELPVQVEQYPEVNYVGDMSYSNAQMEKVSEITCWYKDEDSDIGKFTWVMNTPLEDYPKYFYRRIEHCGNCDAIITKDDDGSMPDECPKCGNTVFVKKIQEFEKIPRDLVLQRQEPVLDGQGQPTYDEMGNQIMQNVVIKKGTKIRYYAPKEFPILIRVNVPDDFGWGGVSDLDLIRPQFNAMKKILNNLTEKVIRSQHVIAKLKEHRINFSSLIYQVIDCDDTAQLQAIRELDLTADINQDLEALKYLYESAKSVLGITDSWQGKDDPSAKSGVAIQTQINQSGGRMQSKIQNKFDAYKELFEMMFYFKLAFYDETRPYVAKDNNGQTKYFDFNKYEYLYFDKEANNGKGEWRYNDDFVFTVDNGAGFLKDKSFVYQQAIQLFEAQALNQLQLWIILDNLNFPFAGMIKKQIQEQIEQQQQQMQEQQQMQAEQQAQQQVQMQQQQGQMNPLQALRPDQQQHFQGLTPQQQQMIVSQLQNAINGGQQ